MTIALVAISVAVYFLGPQLWGPLWRYTLGLIPGLGFEEPWRWITSGFAHHDLIHLGINMLVLFQLGSFVEGVVGGRRMAAIYGVSLLGGSAAIVAFGTANSLHLGASGAVFGLFAAYAILGRRLHLAVGPTLVLPVLWLFSGFFIPGISWQGHLGGVIAGALVTLALLAKAARSRPTRPQASRR